MVFLLTFDEATGNLTGCPGKSEWSAPERTKDVELTEMINCGNAECCLEAIEIL